MPVFNSQEQEDVLRALLDGQPGTDQEKADYANVVTGLPPVELSDVMTALAGNFNAAIAAVPDSNYYGPLIERRAREGDEAGILEALGALQVKGDLAPNDVNNITVALASLRTRTRFQVACRAQLGMGAPLVTAADVAALG